MTTGTTIPQAPNERNVEVVEAPELGELWVIPSKAIDCPSLPDLRHLLPVEFADAPVVGFDPLLDTDTWGAWVLRREA